MKTVHDNMLVDDEFKYLLDEHSWCLDGSGYVVATINKKMVPIHYFVLPKKDGMQTDHINRNKLDNRLCNLRYATQSQNNMNRGMMKNNTSGYRGVYADGNKWRVRIRLNGKIMNFGSYLDIEEAAKAYNKKAVELFEQYLGGTE